MSGNALVILGDVVGSRRMPGRRAFQGRLQDALASVNESWREDLHTPFTILKGVDEVGGILLSVAGLYRIFSRIGEGIHPARIRWALVHGEVDTGLDTGVMARMDGPAFHRAAGMMDGLKRSRLLFDMETGDPVADPLIAGAVNLLLFAREDWTEREREVQGMYRDGKSQEEIAGSLGITQQAVSQALRRIRWGETALLEASLDGALRKYEERRMR